MGVFEELYCINYDVNCSFCLCCPVENRLPIYKYRLLFENNLYKHLMQ